VGPDDLRLNSLDRFTKKSPRFILEEHSHCEVPAGCGGVVLRWINPAAGLPVLIDFFHPAEARVAIDGTPVTTAHLLLAPGRHVLSIEFPDPPRDGNALLVLVGRLKISTAAGRDEVIVHSVADGSWIFTTSAPPPAWMTDSALGEQGWTPLVERPVVEPPPGSKGSYAFHRTTAYGPGRPLGVPAGTPGSPICIRKVFMVPAVGPR
jgi:hypothetical protein